MWMVPISICTSDDPTSAKMQVLMDKPELTLVLKDVKPDQWVKVSGHKGAVSLVVTLMFSFIPASSSLSFFLANLYFLCRGLSVLLLDISSCL